ncbi:nitrate reductase [Malaciobacter halophilus]|uniref:Chaperone NapD n=1 Tax=Malaciobacter halophilus TaxID=197482 RepID=A0A2N1J654_9BACT|nr:chaperone NapD [Malaciobacter halophilus]AXH08817.1 periplasmic nitrate reductase assembly protein [Malaciobacter halophilus]PKI82047.1 nitrate reductase [Malaciobacter halophilus]
MNISSIVVQTLPKHLDEVVQNLKECEACDYHMHDEIGRVIITIEGKNVEEELEKLRVIESLPHIISADMQMAYSEEELNEHMQVLENSDVVPSMLNDDNINPDDIVYSGDLKKKNVQGFAKHFDKIGK